MRKGLAYSTKYSQAVTHPSTNLAQCCLTSVIGRELVCSTWYGRRHVIVQDQVTFQYFPQGGGVRQTGNNANVDWFLVDCPAEVDFSGWRDWLGIR